MRRTPAVLLLISAALATPGGAAARAVEPAASIWSIVPSPSPGHGVFNALLEGVSATSAGDAWAVGGDSSKPSGSLAEHWDGAAWTAVRTPHVAGRASELHDVAALSPGDAWAVGESRLADGTGSRTLIEHWDGAGWRVVRSPNLSTAFGSSNTLDGVAAVGPDDVWATGWGIDPTGTTIELLFAYWNGRRWRLVPSPTPLGSFQFGTAIAALSSDDVWAVGYDATLSPERTIAAHWDGRAWSLVPTLDLTDGTPPDNRLESVAALAPDDVWAVGYEQNIDGQNRQRSLVEHWDGASWSIVPSPNREGGGAELFGVTALGADDVWAVGESRSFASGVQHSLTMRWDGSAWTIAPSPNGVLTTTPLAAASLPGGTVLAVGGTEQRGQCCLRTLVLRTTQG
jgi:hypothetical protein